MVQVAILRIFEDLGRGTWVAITMGMNEQQTQERGRNMLAAIERILASDETIQATTRRVTRLAWSPQDAARRVVRHYATSTAGAGALAAVPALLPGVGTMAAIVGTVSVEMVFMMKTEVEMCLALLYLFGGDLEDPSQRQMAFLLAAVSTHDVATGRNLLVDLGESSWDALWSYTPRELSKLVAKVFGFVALAHAAERVGRGILLMMPVLSVGIGAGLNYAFTLKVGRAATGALLLRWHNQMA